MVQSFLIFFGRLVIQAASIDVNIPFVPVVPLLVSNSRLYTSDSFPWCPWVQLNTVYKLVNMFDGVRVQVLIRIFSMCKETNLFFILECESF